MSKAEERAEEFCKSTIAGSSYIKKMAYIQGYHQAEKDLELTWEDIKVIEKLLGFDIIIEPPKEFYQDVLKRFKAQKGE